MLEVRFADRRESRLIFLPQQNLPGERDAETQRPRITQDLNTEFARGALHRDEVFSARPIRLEPSRCYCQCQNHGLLDSKTALAPQLS